MSTGFFLRPLGRCRMRSIIPNHMSNKSENTDSSKDAPRSIAPTPRLSGRGLLLLLLLVSLLPLVSLSVYAIFFGRAADHDLPVEVLLDKRPVNAIADQGSVLTDVVVVKNLAEYSIPNLTINLNGQYFLYQNSPLEISETLVLPQQIFKTKANQTFVPGRYSIDEVTVTGRLPSGARGVAEVRFPELEPTD